MDKKNYQLLYAVTILFFSSIPLHIYGQLFIEAPDFFPTLRSNDLSKNVAIADIDKDGDYDMILAMESGNNVILVNYGESRYISTNVTGATAQSTDIATADFDGDSNLDLLFVSKISSQHDFFSNNGQGKFTNSSLQVGLNGSNVVKAIDINLDGRPDLLIGREGQNMLLINKGNGEFRDETAYRLPERYDKTNDLSFFDFDKDGDQDIFVSNKGRNLLLVNNGNGGFTDETVERLPAIPFLNTQATSIGDIDNDGYLDIYIANANLTGRDDAQNRLLKNVDGEYFFDITLNQLPKEILQSVDAEFIDIDNDGDLDITTANNGHQPISLYENDGKANFTDVTTSYLEKQSFKEVYRIISQDFNNDGYSDIYVCLKGQSDLLLLRDPNGTPAVSTGTNETIAYAKSIRLYPNPVNTNFTLDFPEEISKAISFELFDLTGKRIQILEPRFRSKSSFQFNLEGLGLSTSIYFLRINTENNSYTKKIQTKF